MHASIWRYKGEPEALLRSYNAMLAEMPAEGMRLHLCMRTDDGILVFDTCPSREIFDGFVGGSMRELSRRHGLPEPDELEDFPVEVAIVDGERRG